MKQNSKFALLKQIIIQSNEEKNAKKVGNKINAKSTFQKKNEIKLPKKMFHQMAFFVD